MIQRGTNHERYINVGYNLNHPGTSSSQVSCRIVAILGENLTDQTMLLERGGLYNELLPAINKICGLEYGKKTNIT